MEKRTVSSSGPRKIQPLELPANYNPKEKNFVVDRINKL
jgi:hypothetical protein